MVVGTYTTSTLTTQHPHAQLCTHLLIIQKQKEDAEHEYNVKEFENRGIPPWMRYDEVESTDLRQVCVCWRGGGLYVWCYVCVCFCVHGVYVVSRTWWLQSMQCFVWHHHTPPSHTTITHHHHTDTRTWSNSICCCLKPSPHTTIITPNHHHHTTITHLRVWSNSSCLKRRKMIWRWHAWV